MIQQLMKTNLNMKARIINVEFEDLIDFCYNHGGVRIVDSWYDAEKKTTRFLTSDKKHPDSDYYSYVYICNEIGPMHPMDIISQSRTLMVATCKDEEDAECYILCRDKKVGDELEFEKLGFSPYGMEPELNYYGRNRDY